MSDADEQARDDKEETKQGPLRELVQPFIDLVHAPRALWGINLGYVLEGMVYFGMLGYLAIHFSELVFQGVEHADEWSHSSVMVLTAGITIAMFFLGTVADKWGVRQALLLAFVLALVGRGVMSAAPTVLGFEPPRPTVRPGDTIDLRVSKLGDRDGNKVINGSTLLSRKAGTPEAAAALVTDLAADEGITPDSKLAGKLVALSQARVVGGKGQEWQLSYGSGPAKGTLVLHGNKARALCVGAVIRLDRAYIHLMPKTGPVIRSHWGTDLASIDAAGCKKKPTKEDLVAASEPDEGDYLAAVTPPADKKPSGGTKTTLAALIDKDLGEVDLLLEGVTVSYVRNGGYYIQASKGGPAIQVFLDPLWSPLHLLTLLGILFIVIGYGMYQPAAYAAVRQFTTPKTAAMGFAMLYALMNLGGWLPTFAFLVRDKDYLGLGITGTFWIYTGVTALALVLTLLILSRGTVKKAIARVKEETARLKTDEDDKQEGGSEGDPDAAKAAAPARTTVPLHMWLIVGLCLVAVYFKVDAPTSYYVIAAIAAAWTALSLLPRTSSFIANHPLADSKFFFFIFCLIPVQTLFTYNWLVLPQYINRAFDGWIGEYFEIAANANPILIFILVPVITAVSQRAKVYNMMILGTFIMAAPAFLLAVGPQPWALFTYILIMTIGEAMWQPRFLQYAAEIAPEGRTGEYMGVAQLPWFLTKVLVPLLYSGWMMDRYCPAEGVRDTSTMWLWFGVIAIASPIMLIIAKGWLGKDFKTSAD